MAPSVRRPLGHKRADTNGFRMMYVGQSEPTGAYEYECRPMSYVYRATVVHCCLGKSPSKQVKYIISYLGHGKQEAMMC